MLRKSEFWLHVKCKTNKHYKKQAQVATGRGPGRLQHCLGRVFQTASCLLWTDSRSWQPPASTHTAGTAAGTMNPMNVNFFICENLYYFVPIFFCLGPWFLCFCLFVVRGMAAKGGTWGALVMSGSQVIAQAVPGSRSLAPSACLACFFSFKIGIFHVEPAI